MKKHLAVEIDNRKSSIENSPIRNYTNPNNGHNTHNPPQMMKNPITSNNTPARIIRRIGTNPDP